MAYDPETGMEKKKKKKPPPGDIWYARPEDYMRSDRPGTPIDPNAIPDSGDPATRGLRRFTPAGPVEPTIMPQPTIVTPQFAPPSPEPLAQPAQPTQAAPRREVVTPRFATPITPSENPLKPAAGQDVLDNISQLLEAGGIITHPDAPPAWMTEQEQYGRTGVPPAVPGPIYQPPVGGSIWPETVPAATQAAPPAQVAQRAEPGVVTPRFAQPEGRLEPARGRIDLPEAETAEGRNRLKNIAYMADLKIRQETADGIAKYYDFLMGKYKGDVTALLNAGTVLPIIREELENMGPGTTTLEAVQALTRKPSDAEVEAKGKEAEKLAVTKKAEAKADKLFAATSKSVADNIKALEADTGLSRGQRTESVKEQYDRWIKAYGKENEFAPDEIKKIEERMDAGLANPYIEPAKEVPTFSTTEQTKLDKVLFSLFRGRPVKIKDPREGTGWEETIDIYKGGAVPARNIDEYMKLPNAEKELDAEGFRELLYKGGKLGEGTDEEIIFKSLPQVRKDVIARVETFIEVQALPKKKPLLKKALEEIGNKQFLMQLGLPENDQLRKAWAKGEGERLKTTAPAESTTQPAAAMPTQAEYDAMSDEQKNALVAELIRRGQL